MNLYLMRHAAALTNNSLDSERNISTIGEEEAFQTGSFLETQEIGQAIISSILRARKTYKIISDLTEQKIDVRFSNYLYKSTTSEYISEIKALGNINQNLLVIGHNPTISELAKQLSIENFWYKKFLEKKLLPTASVVVLSFINITTWGEFNIEKRGNIKEIFVPKIWE